VQKYLCVVACKLDDHSCNHNFPQDKGKITDLAFRFVPLCLYVLRGEGNCSD